MILVRLYREGLFLGALNVGNRCCIPQALNTISGGQGCVDLAPIGPTDPTAILKITTAGCVMLYLNNLDYNNTAAILKERGWTIHEVRPLFTLFSYVDGGVSRTIRCETDGAIYRALSQSDEITHSPTLRRRDAQREIVKPASPELIAR